MPPDAAETPKTASSSTMLPLTKQERKRLKKLRKRASSSTTTGAVGGIHCTSDYIELEQLLVRQQHDTKDEEVKLPYPSVQWRDTADPERLIDACQHAEILHRLNLTIATSHGQATAGTKRKRQEKNTNDNEVWHDAHATLPSWVMIQNPVSVQHVCVLELSLDTRNQLERVRDRLEQCIANHNVLSCPTCWFPDHQVPKSISSSLLYTSVKPKRRTCPKSIVSLMDLHQALETLVVTPEEWRDEGYPMIEEQESSPVRTVPSNERNVTTPGSLSLSEAQAILEGCHVKMEGDTNSDSKSNGPLLAPYVERPAASDSRPSSSPPRIFALDCEMVLTTAGSELARLTLVQVEVFNDGKVTTRVVWDELVQPQHKVVNYLTQHSGVTATMLKNVTTQLEQVQAALLCTIAPNDIVIGHSLENDLIAARWIHRNVIDTSLLFRTNRRFKYKLRHLAAVLLQKRIQEDQHCSHQDAVTALELAVGRAVQGPDFCIIDRNNRTNRLTTSWAKSTNGATVCVGPRAWLDQHVLVEPSGIHALQCETIHDPNTKAVTAWLNSTTKKNRCARLVWAHWALQNDSDVDALDGLVQKIVENMSKTTIVVIAMQCGYERAAQLTKGRRARQDPRSTVGWSTQQEETYQAAVDACRTGTTLWISAKI